MGISKRLVLAWTVSVMAIGAFLVGLIPPCETPGANAEDDGRVDMAKLLAAVLGAKDLAPPIIACPWDGVRFKLADDQSENVWLCINAESTDPGLTGGIALAVDGEVTGGNVWSGDLAEILTEAPYAMDLDLNWLSLNSVGEAHELYGLLNPQPQAGPSAYNLLFDPALATRIPFDVARVDATAVDANGDGIPDDPLDATYGVQPGEMFVRRMPGGPLVATANLLKEAAKDEYGLEGVALSFENVQVVAPSHAMLVEAGLVPAEDDAFVIVMLAESLEQALSNMAAEGLVDSIAAKQPQDRLFNVSAGTFAQYVEISIIYNRADDGRPGDFDEIEALPDEYPVELTMTGLDDYDSTPARFMSYPTDVSAGVPLVVSIDDNDDWRDNFPGAIVDETGTLTADLTTLSLIAPFRIGLKLLLVSPNQGPASGGNSVLITNGFDLGVTAHTAEEAEAVLQVYFGASLAQFDDTRPTIIDCRDIYVLAPPGAVGDVVDITVQHVQDPNDFDVLGQAYTYLAEPTVTSVTPNKGPTLGGTPVIVRGTGLGTASAVYFGEVSVATRATDLTVLSDTEVAVETPPHAAPGLVSVFVTTGAGQASKDLAFEYTLDSWTLATAAAPADKGTVDPAGVHYYAPGTVVQVSAEPVGGWALDHWVVNGVNSGSGPMLEVTMDRDQEVTAVFKDETQGDVFALTAAVLPAGAGTIDVNPPGDVYPAGTTVSVTATNNPGWEFDRWEVNSNVIGSKGVYVLDLVMDEDKVVTAFFVKPLPEIEPSEAWLFGGVVARVTGAGFTQNTTVTFDDVGADVIGWAEAELLVIVPRWNGPQGVEATVEVTVSVGDPGETPIPVGEPFTYYRYRTVGDVNMTAFVYDASEDPDAEIRAAVRLDAASNALLTLPVGAGKDASDVYGLVRAGKTPESLLTDLITDDLEQGLNTLIEDVWDFDVHLYQDDPALNTPSLTVKDPTYAEIDGWAYDRADENPGRLDFPVYETALTVADVKSGLALWAIDYDFDYVDNVVPNTPSLATAVYQSTLGADDVLPQITGRTPDTSDLQWVYTRLYDLSAFSLRRNTQLSEDMIEEVAEDIELDPTRHPTGTSSGYTWGGKRVYLYSESGGLGYAVDRVEFGESTDTKAFTGVEATIVEPRDDEFHLIVRAPAYDQGGLVDIAIYPKSATAGALEPWVIEDAYEYKALPKPPTWPGGILAALLSASVAAVGGIAALGAGAGGDGGGGPCFIATAAYGTPLATEIDALRAVRDAYLLDSALGTAFVDTYYRVSPAVASLVAQSPALAATVRIALTPVVWAAKLLLAAPPHGVLLAMAGAVWLLSRRKRREG